MHPRRFKAAATQLPFAWARSPQDYFDRMHAPVARAAAMGAELVVLPLYAGDMLVGVQVPSEPTASRAEIAARGGFTDWAACVRHSAETTSQFYVHTFETLAARYSVYLMPGTISLPGDTLSGVGAAKVYHASFLFGPDGEVLGEQRQLFPAGDDDCITGFGGELEPIETSLGRIGIIVGNDALHPKVRRSAATKGCTLLLNPIGCRDSSPAEFSTARWQSLLSEGITVVESGLAGGEYRGGAAIYGPLKQGSGAGGILVSGSTELPVDVVCAEIEIGAADSLLRHVNG
jgi:predicted amidohydrolase